MMFIHNSDWYQAKSKGGLQILCMTSLAEVLNPVQKCLFVAL